MTSSSHDEQGAAQLRTMTMAPLGFETPDGSQAAIPARIGRYRVDRVLGRGGFGVVYLAQDEQLERLVAIKVPHAKRLADPEIAATYLNEAQMVASLDHPHIVPVYDVGSTAEVPCYLVSKYVDGSSLAVVAKSRTFSLTDAARLVATIAEALHYAHLRGIVHRDVKPGNILIDDADRPYVVDFGVALRDHDVRPGGGYEGTPSYMSPEQARGEGHRVDGRSDIFSLGVVMYELLTGRRPFAGETTADVLERVATLDPKPPRQVRDGIPRELERICLRAISKRASSRYTTAGDMAEDLRHFVRQSRATTRRESDNECHEGDEEQSARTTSPIRSADGPHSHAGAAESLSSSASHPAIVPKGLCAFDEHDADFFLDLLPGPRDRTGLPDSIRFWKTRIEASQPDRSFPAGIIYGPSGCGKSSFVRAGLLAHLDPEITTVIVEASADNTESKLLNAIQARCPEASRARTLKEAVAALRRGHTNSTGSKFLIVIDQLEQWLHAHHASANTELIQSLRQCDGVHVQCLTLVRDDFYVAVNRFFQELEVPIKEGYNYALVDLFDFDHARKVLASFGRAYGKLDRSEHSFTEEQQRFLDQAVHGLAQEGRVISVRLSLFAEMMKGRDWSPNSLRSVGGPEGVGVMFLKETFSAHTAPPTHRLHQSAAQAVLQALLPPAGTDLKGHRQTVDTLREVSGYAERPKDFRSLLILLEQETRLIAPTEVDIPGNPQERQDDHCYQLTHDFLVPALREWLFENQQRTSRGRAQLRLVERAALWSGSRERKQLPTLREWLSIRLFTRPTAWTGVQKRMMSVATHHHLVRTILVTVLVLVMVGTGVMVRNQITSEAERHRRQVLADQLWTIELQELPQLLDELEPLTPQGQSKINGVINAPNTSEDERVRGYLALVRNDVESLHFLRQRLLMADPEEYDVLRSELSTWKDAVTPSLWADALKGRLIPDQLLRAAGALADYDPHNEHWRAISSATARALVGQDLLKVLRWSETLHPVSRKLRDPLEAIARDQTVGESGRLVAASVLAHYASEDEDYLSPDKLALLLSDATPDQYRTLIPLAESQADDVARYMSDLLERQTDTQGANSEQLVERQANAAVTLLRLDREDSFWRSLQQSENPRLRASLMARIRPGLIRWERLVERLAIEKNGGVRQAILLGWDAYRESLPAGHGATVEQLVTVFEKDPDPGAHAAAEWLLRQWGCSEELIAAKERLAGMPRNARQWLINDHLQALAIVSSPGTFTVGSPEDEPGRDPHEVLRDVTLDYTFAVGMYEVTIEEFELFRSKAQHAKSNDESMYPAHHVSWYEAVEYCRWLSEQEGIPQCYPPVSEIGQDLQLPEDYFRKPGYRLLTEEEWEYCARAGSATSRFFGSDESQLSRYAWYSTNAGWLHSVGELYPNPLGLFDVYGNVSEWCDVTPASRYPERRVLRGGHYRSTPRFLRSAMPEPWRPDAELSFIGFRIARTISAPNDSAAKKE